MRADRRIDRALGDRTAIQSPVFGVAPCAFVLTKSLSPCAELVKMRLGVNEKVAMFFVMNKGEAFGIVERRVTDLVLVEAKVMMQEDADITRVYCQVRHSDSTQKDIFVTRYRVTAR